MDKEHYTRVTDVLSPFSGMDKIDPFVLKRAADRGTRVHTFCGGIINGFGTPDIDDEAKGYVDSFRQWWNDDMKVIAQENRFFDSKYQLTGQVDLIVNWKNMKYLVDFKTSAAPQKSWMLQLSAYEYLAKKDGFQVDGVMVLQLKKDGKEPRVISYQTNWGLFLDCLNAYRYFYEKEKTG